MAETFINLKELVFLFPDSVLFGSFFIGLITLSSQQFIFSLSLLESLIFLSGFQTITSYMYGGELPLDKCKSHFHKTTFFDSLLLDTSANIPSYSAYIISVACSYLAFALYSLSDELEVVDPLFYKRYIQSFWLLYIVSFLYCLFLIFSDCDSMSAILSGFFIGSAIGVFLIYQNVNLLGKDYINFLGIPLLRNKTVNNQPLYFCSSTSS